MSEQTQLPATVHSSVIEDIVGLGEKRLRQLSAEGTIPARTGRAEYPFADTLRALIKYYKKRSEAGENSDLERKLDLERLRKLRIANARASHEVINVSEAKKVHSDLLIVFVQKTDDLPDKLAQSLANRPAEFIRQRLKDEMFLLRSALAATPDYKFEDDVVEEEEAEDDV